MTTICTLACQALADCPTQSTEACPARTGAPHVTLSGQVELDLGHAQ